MSIVEARTFRASAIEQLRGYVILTKPRINALLMFTAYSAAIVAAGGFPDWKTTFLLLVGLALSGGGAAALNMWYDRDIDRIMSRTRHRPLPQGVIRPSHALVFSIALGIVSVLVFWTWVNPLTAGLSAAGYLYYGVVYTMLLKRRTPQNIVIGGGAGAFPPLIGWAAVTGNLSAAAWGMFLVILLWTPSHFWSLALYKNSDYKAAGVPMMPVVRGSRSTRRLCFVYSFILLVVTVAVAATGGLGWLYAVPAGLASLAFLEINRRLLYEPEDRMTWAKRTFIGSLMMLPAVFGLMVAATLIHGRF